MAEMSYSPENDTIIHGLKIEIALLTLNPDTVHNFESEYDRSSYIDGLKERLSDYGIDGNEYQVRVITDNLKTRTKAPLGNVVHVDSDR